MNPQVPGSREISDVENREMLSCVSEAVAAERKGVCSRVIMALSALALSATMVGAPRTATAQESYLVEPAVFSIPEPSVGSSNDIEFEAYLENLEGLVTEFNTALGNLSAAEREIEGRDITDYIEDFDRMQRLRLVGLFAAGMTPVEAVVQVAPELSPESPSMPTQRQLEMLFPQVGVEVIEAFYEAFENLSDRSRPRFEQQFASLLYPTQEFILQSFAQARTDDMRLNIQVIASLTNLVSQMEDLARYINLNTFPESGELPDAVAQLQRIKDRVDALEAVLPPEFIVRVEALQATAYSEYNARLAALEEELAAEQAETAAEQAETTRTEVDLAEARGDLIAIQDRNRRWQQAIQDMQELFRPSSAS